MLTLTSPLRQGYHPIYEQSGSVVLGIILILINTLTLHILHFS